MSVAVSAPPLFRDHRLEPLWDKVQAGERLDRDEGLLLFETEDLHGVGRSRTPPSRAATATRSSS